jgi:MoaA/NifB/PqqE/SkfB family radical SAM enzyme
MVDAVSAERVDGVSHAAAGDFQDRYAARPLQVIMDLTEKCNLKCRMCYFSSTDRLQFAPLERSLSANGMMPIEVFEKIAADLFPRARRVALACACEPLIHPRFSELVRIAGRYAVEDLWFPTNLLALTREKAEAIIEAGVRAVGVSIDGTDAASYEGIRVGGKFDRLEKCLELLNEVRRGSRTQLRFIFTWMRSNRPHLAHLPEFAESHGATELDVRFVTPTVGVDNTPELLDGEDQAAIRDELRSAAEDAVRRGLWLYSYPEFEQPEDLPTSWWGKRRRRRWRERAGMDRYEYEYYRWRERLNGCVWPADFLVVRPNGAVSPCIFWDRAPIGFYPEDDYQTLRGGQPLQEILHGLRSGCPVGTCVNCSERRDALYQSRRAFWSQSEDQVDGQTTSQTPDTVDPSPLESKLVELGGFGS